MALLSLNLRLPTIIFISIVSVTTSAGNVLKNDVCDTELCWKNARYFLNAINFTVDPCDDFDAFVCGNWKKTTKIPETESYWGTFSEMQEKTDLEVVTILKTKIEESDPPAVKSMKDFFIACTNKEKLEEVGYKYLFGILNYFGGWPIISQYWVEENFFWQNFLSETFRLYSLRSLLNIQLSSDLTNKSVTLITLDQGTTIFPLYILKEPKKYSKFIETYMEWIRDSAIEFLISEGRNDISLKLIEKEAQEIVNFEIKLAKILKLDELRSDFTKFNNIFTIQQLQKKTDILNTTMKNKMNWLILFGNIFRETQVSISSSTKILVYEVNFIKEIFHLIDNTAPRVLANYLGWTLVKLLSQDTTEKMKQLSYQVDRVVLGIESGPTKEMECKEKVTKFFTPALSYQYIKRNYDSEKKIKLITMTNLIHKIIQSRIKSISWMDEETKLKALEKANSLNFIFGFTTGLDDSKHLEEQLADLVIGDNHFKNIIFLYRYHVKRSLEKLVSSAPITESDLGDPTIVNAFNFRNSIYILNGILQFPMFEKNRPEALNYGAMGTVIGHEIIHSFDNKGSQFDEKGNLVNWWSNKTSEVYNKKVKCFIDFYDKYKVEELKTLDNTKQMINGKLTLAENIADVESITSAFEAYKLQNERTAFNNKLPGELNKFTPDQLFFLSYARKNCEIVTPETLLNLVQMGEHPPSRYRTIGSLANSPDFANAFKCPLGSAMNPEKKCSIW